HVRQAQGYESFVDGFIVYGPPQQERMGQLVQMQKSIITVDFDLEGFVSVNIDNYSAARECAAHALRNQQGPVTILGLRLLEANRICRIQDNELFDEGSTITIQRLHGFRDAAAAENVEIPTRRIFHIPDNTHALGYQAARDALTRSPRPTLLLCMSDRIALAAIQAARHLGYRVPQDVRITGFDDIPEAATHHPSLTTVHQQSIDKGRIAAEIYQGKRLEQSLVLPTELITRESCP
ncbi:MAG: substrate-binding domain-containing protein, partial [Pseudomonadota bacterium]